MIVKFLVPLPEDIEVSYLIALREAIAEHIAQAQGKSEVNIQDIMIKILDDKD